MLNIPRTNQRKIVEDEIEILLQNLGVGHVEGVAYDTAWVGRLVRRYPDAGFEQCLQWLRHNQYDDGTWGGSFVHYHDRFISTLAAIVALREVGTDPRDERRVKRGEDALWRYVGKLSRDDSDTVGFPIIAASLAEEAHLLDLEVPSPPVRHAQSFRKKIRLLLEATQRDWFSTTLTFSLESLRYVVEAGDNVVDANYSISMSPAATAGYLLRFDNKQALQYLTSAMMPDGSVPAVTSIDVFEIAWAIQHLRSVGAIRPDNVYVRNALEELWVAWNHTNGVAYSSFWRMVDADDTSAAYMVLKWGGYPVDSDVFRYFETEDSFFCFKHESNPSMSTLVRLLCAFREYDDDSIPSEWIDKILRSLEQYDENGTFWWDKWHSSPYYVNSMALETLREVAPDLAATRLKWILRTQNDDGGWGYLGYSSSEETAYCLLSLIKWDQTVGGIPTRLINLAADYLVQTFNEPYVPFWIGKSLYTPYQPIRAIILAALYSYYEYYD